MKYVHPSYGVVTAVAHFSSHVNVMTSHGLRSVSPRDLMPYVDESTQASDSSKPEPEPVASVAPEELPEPVVALESENNSESSSSDEVSETSSDKNKGATLSVLNGSVSRIARDLPFIGAKRAKKVIENRPAENYTSFEQFRELNSSLFEGEDTWEKIREAVEKQES